MSFIALKGAALFVLATAAISCSAAPLGESVRLPGQEDAVLLDVGRSLAGDVAAALRAAEELALADALARRDREVLSGNYDAEAGIVAKNSSKFSVASLQVAGKQGATKQQAALGQQAAPEQQDAPEEQEPPKQDAPEGQEPPKQEPTQRPEPPQGPEPKLKLIARKTIAGEVGEPGGQKMRFEKVALEVWSRGTAEKREVTRTYDASGSLSSAEVVADLKLGNGLRAKASRNGIHQEGGKRIGRTHLDLVGPDGEARALTWNWEQLADGSETGSGTIALRGGGSGACSYRRTASWAVATASDAVTGVTVEVQTEAATTGAIARIFARSGGRLLETVSLDETPRD